MDKKQQQPSDPSDIHCSYFIFPQGVCGWKFLLLLLLPLSTSGDWFLHCYFAIELKEGQKDSGDFGGRKKETRPLRLNQSHPWWDEIQGLKNETDNLSLIKLVSRFSPSSCCCCCVEGCFRSGGVGLRVQRAEE